MWEQLLLISILMIQRKPKNMLINPLKVKISMSYIINFIWLLSIKHFIRDILMFSSPFTSFTNSMNFQMIVIIFHVLQYYKYYIIMNYALLELRIILLLCQTVSLYFKTCYVYFTSIKFPVDIKAPFFPHLFPIPNMKKFKKNCFLYSELINTCRAIYHHWISYFVIFITYHFTTLHFLQFVFHNIICQCHKKSIV